MAFVPPSKSGLILTVTPSARYGIIRAQRLCVSLTVPLVVKITVYTLPPQLGDPYRGGFRQNAGKCINESVDCYPPGTSDDAACEAYRSSRASIYEFRLRYIYRFLPNSRLLHTGLGHEKHGWLP